MIASPEDQARVRRELDAVEQAVRSLGAAPDTEAMRARLATAWSAIRKALQTVNDVEESTRNNALRQLEKPDVHA